MSDEQPSLHSVDDFDEPLEFVEFLGPHAPRWGFGPEPEWYFRGQGDAVWGLKPRAWRAHPILEYYRRKFESSGHPDALMQSEGAAIRYKENFPDGIDWLPRMRELVIQLYAEMEAERQFSILAEDVGFRIPLGGAIGVESHRDIETVKDAILRGYHPGHLKTAFPVLSTSTALAQHHGMPTRLLDWTRNPLTAAYFALQQAEQHLTDSQPPQRLVVWAIKKEWLSSHDEIREMNAPGSEHKYLLAQEALFLVDRESNIHYMKTGEWPDLQESVQRLSETESRPPLRKVTLKIADTTLPSLRLFLFRYGQSASKLMPHLDNVTRTLETKLKLEQGK